ncbi:hypothetical protein WDW89_24945 [Deltaproteobacteria bacterium TL4]
MLQRILYVVIALLFSASVHAQSIDERCTQNGPSACIDWDRGVVIAEGVGAPSRFATNSAVRNASAIRAARLDAARNLLEMIKGVNISSNTTMQEAMIATDEVRTQVQGKLDGLRPVGEPRYFSDGSVKLRMEARLRNTIPDEFVYRTESEASNFAPVPLQPFPLQAPLAKSDSGPQIDINRVYTGLIIDASQIEVQPAMSPKIIDEQGKEVYGSAYVDRGFVLKHGMAGYVKTMDKAQQNDRVQDKPLVVKALGSAGKNKTDIVIKNEDAQKLRQIAATQSFLREARVVIVLK